MSFAPSRPVSRISAVYNTPIGTTACAHSLGLAYLSFLGLVHGSNRRCEHSQGETVFPQTKLTEGSAAWETLSQTFTYTASEDGRGPISGALCRANPEGDASFQAHDQCRRELCLGHPCGQIPSSEGDRTSYACGGWMPPPPLVTLLPLVRARRRSDPLGRCPEPTYALRWPAPPQAGSLETSAESIRPFASREPGPVYRDRSRPARAGHYAAQHRRSTLPRPA